ncbi:MAG TPA: polysaccharide deacetylase family protein [Pseudonocardia sp.]|nr:polysaccharide deacetylase family protein [Pseudonocardia sp.]
MSCAVPILMYHSVKEDPPVATRSLSVRPSDLRWQLSYLRENGFTGLTFGDFCEMTWTGDQLPARPVVLTFDDGYADVHEVALPLLREYGFTATVFVTTGWMRDAGRWSKGHPLDHMMAWSQVEELRESGIEVAAHSHSHPQLDQLSDRHLRDELSLGKSLLEDRLGQAVPSLAYPFGYSSRRVRRAAEAAGFRHAASVANAAAGSDSDTFAVPRLTVRRSTSLEVFGRVASCRDLRQIFWMDHVLTGGFAVLRRSRRAIRTLSGA